MRRIFDVLAALIGLLLLSPLFVVIAAAILWEGHGPVFYKARRVGLHGKIIRIFKFRTMVVDAEKMGAGITSAGDNRVTRVGQYLRRYKLDEIPQLINIVLGDMNLVGPRPEDPRYIMLYNPDQMHILAVRPGLTSPASLRFKDEEAMLGGLDWEEKYQTELIPAKISMDLEYFNRNTFKSDLILVLHTMAAVITG
jgi:lipopolysaccharide/colanic/teichoic acid biosynthesis glycosyltransferase